MNQRIITHDGRFHADETMAVAILKEFLGDIPVQRTRNVSSEELADPAVWVVDVGSVLDPNNRCFDHHQDGELPSACVLVADFLNRIGIIDDAVHTELDAVLSTISDIDRNGYRSYNGFQFNSLIGTLADGQAGFHEAVGICRKLVKALIKSAADVEESRRIWERGEELHPMVRVCERYPMHWKRFVEACILVYPSNGEWRAVSSDGHSLPLQGQGKETFIHRNRSIAVYRNRKDAEQASLGSVKALHLVKSKKD